MRREASGRHASSVVGGETVRAFVPFPLPPAPPLELTGERQGLLERATLALGRLDSIALLLPDRQLFQYAYVRREAVLSSQIEVARKDIKNLHLGVYPLNGRVRIAAPVPWEMNPSASPWWRSLHGSSASAPRSRSSRGNLPAKW